MKKMNFAGMMGLGLCFVAILFGIATNGGIRTIKNFVHIPSLIITVGGSMFAVLATADSFADYLDGIKSIYYAYRRQVFTVEAASARIIDMAQRVRKEGLLSLEEYGGDLEDDFLKKGIRLIVDGSEAELVRDILESELIHREERNRRRIQFWRELGAFGPAWGMVGTLLGLINMMRTMGADSAAIGAGMSLALITTLYGSVLANWICIPVARKLEKSSEEESLVMEVIIEGVLSVQAGENPRIITEKINSILETDCEEGSEAA